MNLPLAKSLGLCYNQAKRICKFACKKASADCSAVVRECEYSAKRQAETLNTAKEQNINFGRYIMTVNYNKLWKKLIDFEMSRTEMRLKAGISTKQLAKLGKNENVNTEILVKICEAFGCNIDEIMDVTPQKEDTV